MYFLYLFSVLDVATTKEEIFILEGERNLIRISYHPENFTGKEILSIFISTENCMEFIRKF